ncbi:aminotransferase class IV [Amphiplicatus metriothermophilus]|uniref:Probable branched-chain-amino-acid aminotransferase n=1 Tax=Amphiplicatus metriothermophilus TaxID=1519374 RepID=A0A239PK42_9PROT|nr:aminotransferase class IV [Amphiplicatus metriothermophilus]MBB5517974.1 branched-chain amino acid aminotransferase [Amphiplicatus metriothermophilus]SNT67693.1 branched-chain amino acid aminotransferase [Amphiplicatus metriothermophilus]
MSVWLNGDWRESAGAIDAADRGFLLGDGAFETIYVSHGLCAFWPEHAARLRCGLATLRIPAPPALDAVPAIIAELSRREGLAERSAAARVTVSRGSGPRGLFPPQTASPTMLVSLSACEAPRGPARLVASERRRFSAAVASRFKAIGGYIDNMLALDAARRAGADDAILLNERGAVACATSANIFVISADGALVTPRIEDGAMPGVVRGLVLAAAPAVGLVAAEKEISLDAVAGGFVFLTNSLIGLRAARLKDAPPPSKGEESFRALRSCYQRRLDESLTRKGPA